MGHLGTSGGGISRTEASSIYVAGLIAPAPTGVAATDTANLQPLILTAQTSGATLFLQAGHYFVTNLATAASGQHPKIVGKGLGVTYLKATTADAVLTFVGNQTGELSGGYISDLTFDSVTPGVGVGLELQGCVGVGWDRVNFNANLATGILFHNKTAGDYTEICSGQGHFECATALEYRKTSGDSSMRGSGLEPHSFVSQPASATAPSILIGAGCQVYNAPLNVNLTVHTATQPLILNNGLSCDYHGSLQLELIGISTALLVDSASAEAVSFVGDYHVYNDVSLVRGPFNYPTDTAMLVTVGEETLSRLVATGNPTPATGTACFTFFTARKSETKTKIIIPIGAAASGLTVAYVGLYSFNGTTLTRIAVSANSTGSFGSAWTSPSITISSVALTAGTSYAVGTLFAGTTMPQLWGCWAVASRILTAPPLNGALSGQSTLPTSTTLGALSGSQSFYSEIVP